LLQGQALEIFWRENLICPTEKEYFAMINNKTGGLFRMALRLMQAESKSPHSAIDVSTFASLLGQIFQIRDDYINLRSAKYQKEKGFCEDLDEGKYSFLVQHSINSNPLDTTITCLLAKVRAGNTLTLEDKMTALTYLEGTTNTFAYTQLVVERMCSSLEESLDDIVKATGIRNPFFEDILRKLKHLE
jgi:geranylgeranyl diphosphate synthase type 3